MKLIVWLLELFERPKSAWRWYQRNVEIGFTLRQHKPKESQESV